MTVTEVTSGVWQINEADAVDAYLLVGSKRALLIDALHKERGLYAETRKITALPIDVILTHGHGDHAGPSVRELHENGCTIYMDLQDVPILKSLVGDSVQTEWLTDISTGTEFDLGGIKLEVIAVPGHTPGSLVLLERQKQLLFTGDTIGSGYFWMQLPHCLSLTTLLANLEALRVQLSHMDKLMIYPGHRNQTPVDLGLQYIDDVLTITRQLVSGEWAGEAGVMEYEGLHMKYRQISHGLMQGYLYNPEKILQHDEIPI